MKFKDDEDLVEVKEAKELKETESKEEIETRERVESNNLSIKNSLDNNSENMNSSFMSATSIKESISTLEMDKDSFESLDLSQSSIIDEISRDLGVKKSILAVLTTILHSLSIGILIGIYNKPIIISTFILAICLYEWTESLAVGEILSFSSMKKIKIYFIIFFFSCCTPIGIVIGIILEWGQATYNRSVLLGFSAGAFIYICASEIISSEFKQNQGSNKKGFFLYMLGIFFMVMVSVIQQR